MNSCKIKTLSSFYYFFSKKITEGQNLLFMYLWHVWRVAHIFCQSNASNAYRSVHFVMQFVKVGYINFWVVLSEQLNYFSVCLSRWLLVQLQKKVRIVSQELLWWIEAISISAHSICCNVNIIFDFLSQLRRQRGQL